MNYSVFYHHVCQAATEQGCTVEAMLVRIRSWGITHVELDRDAIGQTATQHRALAQQLTACGLRPSSIYGFFDWTTGELPGEDDLLLRQAEALGCEQVMVIPGFHANPADREKCHLEKARMIAATRRFTELAEARGVTVTIECFDDARSPIATIAGMAEFLDGASLLRVTLETGNFIFSGDDVLQAYERFHDRVRHVHLKDRYMPSRVPGGAPAEMLRGTPAAAVTGEMLYPCAVGQGHMPIAEVIRRLAGVGYEGVMTIEHFGAASYAQAIRDSIAWLKEQEGRL